jgi:uncharacterized membrane-anchored protein
MSRPADSRGRYGAAILLGACLTLAVLASVAIKEWKLAHAEIVTLAIRPIDPRSLFQGDYVTLAYEIEDVDLPAGMTIKEGDRVWLLLQPDAQGIAQPAGISLEKPASGIAIAGTVSHFLDCPPDEACSRAVIEYDIGQYFIAEGSGRAIEEAAARDPQSVRVEAAIPPDGKAILVGIKVDGARY